ncbi:MAG: hypothetical protein LCH67_08285 [Bacteroidetes bacterium]|nr:hypothetical protein [Bacteroidota bacterium]
MKHYSFSEWHNDNHASNSRFIQQVPQRDLYAYDNKKNGWIIGLATLLAMAMVQIIYQNFDTIKAWIINFIEKLSEIEEESIKTFKKN